MRAFGPLIRAFERFYTRYDRPLSSVSLIGGFIFDALTLKRVDTLWENLWVVVHLIVVAVAILLLNADEEKKRRGGRFERGHFWLVNILQFFFGGLLSTFIVFYFRSATLTATWPFLLILALAFIANERLKQHYERLVFQVSLLFLSIFSFAIFSIPILIHRIGAVVFLVSGGVSLLIMWGFFTALRLLSPSDYKKERKVLFNAVGFIFVLLNVLYFTNLIPPLPLALKDAGVYHSVRRDKDGNYVAEHEPKNWRSFFKAFEDFHLNPEGSVYAYSAVFSPSSLNIHIIHEWQHLDEEKNRWVTYSKIELPLFGGREGGFRTYSAQDALIGGKWRVNVETMQGQVIGRLLFTIVPSGAVPQLETEIKF